MQEQWTDALNVNIILTEILKLKWLHQKVMAVKWISKVLNWFITVELKGNQQNKNTTAAKITDMDRLRVKFPTAVAIEWLETASGQIDCTILLV